MLAQGGIETRELAARLRDYVRSSLHVSLELAPWANVGSLPVFLAKEFGYVHGRLLSANCVFVLVGPEADMTPAELGRRHDSLKRATDDVIIFTFDHMSSCNRARLIERAVPFVVPGNQLYVPSLAADLREHFRARPPGAEDHLSPAAQVVTLRHLLLLGHDDWSPGQLAKDLQYSAMTVGRAFEELASHRLARIEPRGRSKYLAFEADPAETFAGVRDLLRSPVIASHYFTSRPLPEGSAGFHVPARLPLGGLTALSERSMIASSGVRHFAVGPADWKALRDDKNLSEVAIAEDGQFALDVWRYDPVVVTGERKTDPLSLYLQFREDSDERVVSAARHLLEPYPWFQDQIGSEPTSRAWKTAMP
ncbi:MAG: hypothetical protein F4X97_12985 [Boseongicola sp. SB0662_bin_57]|nr:hypothetical protein [Boseongicola sp. SB0662_bin_57]